jgi:SnoaL-like domain
MSADRIQLVEDLNRAFNSREDWTRFYDTEAELHTPPEWLDQSVYRGHDGLREVLNLWTESFDEYQWSQERLIEGDDAIVGLYHQRGRIKGVDSWIEQPIGCVYRFRGDKVSRLDVFFSWDAAITAAGVSV